MMALAKRLLPADRVARSGEYDAARVKPVNDIAYNWPGLTDIGGLFGRTRHRDLRCAERKFMHVGRAPPSQRAGGVITLAPGGGSRRTP
jgi:hypothetical protein